jgi:hypothetical protein
MASNTNKRVAVKHVRDRAKSAYEKKECCHICSSTDNLELHHTTSLTLLLDKWSRDTGNPISTDEEVLNIRDQFIDEHHSEIYVEVFTLCLKHHLKLHSVFGKAPPLTSSTKQNRWIEIQKAKVLGIVDGTPKAGSFAKFY